jgi:hypothetical protein
MQVNFKKKSSAFPKDDDLNNIMKMLPNKRTDKSNGTKHVSDISDN